MPGDVDNAYVRENLVDGGGSLSGTIRISKYWTAYTSSYDDYYTYGSYDMSSVNVMAQSKHGLFRWAYAGNSSGSVTYLGYRM